jgi:polysaccharide pyruvyl transferase WcaK-like protein
MKIISVIAATLSGNRGAEAMLTTTIGRIRDRYPDAHFNVYSYYPKRDRALSNDPNITIFSATPLYLVTVLFPCSILLSLLKFSILKTLRMLLPKSVRALDTSDVLIDLAGVSFIDGREKFLPYNVFTLMPAFILKTPVVKFAQAIGPLHNRLNRSLAMFTLSRTHKIFARGHNTYNHLKTLSIDTYHPEPVADIAFLHQARDTLTHENPKKLGQLEERLKRESRELIGICPSSVLAGKLLKDDINYAQHLTTICHQLIERGYAVLLYPNATRETDMSKLRNNDLPIISDIVNRLGNEQIPLDSVYFVDFDINTIGIKRLMSYCRLVMVSRFHAMIAALTDSQPVIVLGWSHKYQEVMAYFDLDDLVFDFTQLEADVILSAIKRTLDMESSIRQQIEQHHESIEISAYKQINYVIDLLDNGSSCI